MKNLIILFYLNFLAVCAFEVSAQSSNLEKDRKSIHGIVIENMSKGIIWKKAYVFSSTDKRYSQEFNYKGLANFKSLSFLQEASWKSFLSNIDTNTIVNYELCSNSKAWFKRTVGKSKKRKTGDLLVFSPIVFSEDYRHAVTLCTRMDENGYTTMIYLLTKENERWKLLGTNLYRIVE